MVGQMPFTPVGFACVDIARPYFAKRDLLARGFGSLGFGFGLLFRLQFSRELADGQFSALAPRYAEAEAARQALLTSLAGALPEGDERVADLYRLVWGTAHGLAFLVVERVFQLVQTDEERIAAADEAIALLVESLRARRGSW